MVKIYNKSNRPLGIAGKAVLPDQELVLKDKDVFCEAYDEDGFSTGEKVLIPGLRALEDHGLCTVKIEADKAAPAKKKAPVIVKEEAEEEAVEEEPKKAKRSRAKKTTEE